MAMAGVWLGIGLLAVFAVDALHARIPPDSGSGSVEAFVPDPELARLLSLGFQPVSYTHLRANEPREEVG